MNWLTPDLVVKVALGTVTLILLLAIAVRFLPKTTLLSSKTGIPKGMPTTSGSTKPAAKEKSASKFWKGFWSFLPKLIAIALVVALLAWFTTFLPQKGLIVYTQMVPAFSATPLVQGNPATPAVVCDATHQRLPLPEDGSWATLPLPVGCKAHADPVVNAHLYTLGCVDMHGVYQQVWSDATCSQGTALLFRRDLTTPLDLKTIDYWFEAM
jgi:hypothetical protein